MPTCVTGDAYFKQYPKPTTPKGWRPGLEELDCEFVAGDDEEPATGVTMGTETSSTEAQEVEN